MTDNDRCTHDCTCTFDFVSVYGYSWPICFFWKCPAQACSQWFAPQKALEALAPSRYNWFDGKSPVWWFGTVGIFPCVVAVFPRCFSSNLSFSSIFAFSMACLITRSVFFGGLVTIQNGWLVEMTRAYFWDGLTVSTNCKEQALNHDRPS